jgi:hypothetical protein
LRATPGRLATSTFASGGSVAVPLSAITVSTYAAKASLSASRVGKWL